MSCQFFQPQNVSQEIVRSVPKIVAIFLSDDANDLEHFYFKDFYLTWLLSLASQIITFLINNLILNAVKTI